MNIFKKWEKCNCHCQIDDYLAGVHETNGKIVRCTLHGLGDCKGVKYNQIKYYWNYRYSIYDFIKSVIKLLNQ